MSTTCFEENGTAYYVMDYIAGGTLAQLVKTRGKLDEATALHYIRQAAETMDYVHSQNRLHLDIKPENIMIGNGNRAVLIDFGVSKQIDSSLDSRTVSTLLGHTPGFSSPEQANNDPASLTPASDVYSLAATLFALLTGKNPPSASNRISGDELLPLPPETSPATRRAIERAMILNKHKRTQSMRQFLNDLSATEPHNQPIAKPASLPSHDNKTTVLVNDTAEKGKSRSKLPIILIGAFVVGAILAYFLLKPGSTAPTIPLTDTVVATEKIETYPRFVDIEDHVFANPEGETFTFSGTARMDSVDVVTPIEGTAIYKYGTYTGEFDDLKQRSGHGTLKQEGETFEGTFTDDWYDQGRITLSNPGNAYDGSYFEGTFNVVRDKNGKKVEIREKKGTWYYSNGKVIRKI